MSNRVPAITARTIRTRYICMAFAGSALVKAANGLLVNIAAISSVEFWLFLSKGILGWRARSGVQSRYVPIWALNELPTGVPQLPHFEAHRSNIAQRPCRRRGETRHGAGIDQPGLPTLEVGDFARLRLVRVTATHQR